MGLLSTRGLQLYAAYGNTPTDIRAYEAHGIPKVQEASTLQCMRHHVVCAGWH